MSLRLVERVLISVSFWDFPILHFALKLAGSWHLSRLMGPWYTLGLLFQA